MEKNIEISLLSDFYGELLKEQQKRAVELYYNDDLSLSEIAEQLDITRQGVRDCIKRAEQRLLVFEDKLGLMERYKRTEEGLLTIERLCSELKGLGRDDTVEKIIKTAKSLHE